MYTVQGHVREQLPAPLLRVPRLVRFSWVDFPANHDVSAMTGDDWNAAVFRFAPGWQLLHKSKAAGIQEKNNFIADLALLAFTSSHIHPCTPTSDMPAGRGVVSHSHHQPIQ